MTDHDSGIHRRSAVGEERPGPGPGSEPESGAALDDADTAVAPTRREAPDRAADEGEVSAAGSSLTDSETAVGGADAVPDTHG